MLTEVMIKGKNISENICKLLLLSVHLKPEVNYFYNNYSIIALLFFKYIKLYI
jgi:hypothetical protein